MPNSWHSAAMLSSPSKNAVTNRTVSSKTLVSLNGIGKPPLCRQGNLSTMSPVYSVNDVSGSDPQGPSPAPLFLRSAGKRVLRPPVLRRGVGDLAVAEPARDAGLRKRERRRHRIDDRHRRPDALAHRRMDGGRQVLAGARAAEHDR